MSSRWRIQITVYGLLKGIVQRLRQDEVVNENTNKINEIVDSSTTSRRYLKLIPLLFWLGMLFYVFVITRAAGGVIPLCVFHFLTGYDCPGCGMTRASTTFIRGDVLQSLSYHPGGILFVIWLTSVTFFQTAEFIRGRDFNPPPLLKTAYRTFVWVGLFTCVSFGIVRLACELLGILPPLE